MHLHPELGVERTSGYVEKLMIAAHIVTFCACNLGYCTLVERIFGSAAQCM